VSADEVAPRARLLGTLCRHWLGEQGRWCGGGEGVRAYVVGPRCRLHTPAALAGRPEPEELPARAADAPRGQRPDPT